jgi:hypothetical protein
VKKRGPILLFDAGRADLIRAFGAPQKFFLVPLIAHTALGCVDLDDLILGGIGFAYHFDSCGGVDWRLC